MCINKLLKKYRNPSNKEIAAYKLVQLNYRCDGFITPYEGTAIIPDQWMQATKTRIQSYDPKPYVSGFHVLKTRAGAEALKASITQRSFIVKVLVRRVKYEGTDGTCGSARRSRNVKNLVAFEMKIASEELNKEYMII